MPSSSTDRKKVPGLSLASLRRQLHVAETAVHSFDFVSDAIPIMSSLQSPTTRTLHAIVANRARFYALEEEVRAAKAEERALQSLVDESEALKETPLLSNFKGRVETEMDKVSANRAVEEIKRSDEPVTATVLLAGGVRSAGIKTTLTTDGEMVITTPDTVTRPVALDAEDRPTHFVPDEDDEIATEIAEQIVFTLPRDAAGTILEVVPSTLLTAAESREKARRAAAKADGHRSPSRNHHLHASSNMQTPERNSPLPDDGAAATAEGMHTSPMMSGRRSHSPLNDMGFRTHAANSPAAGATGGTPYNTNRSMASAKGAAMSSSPLGRKRNAEPQTLTEALCWGVGAPASNAYGSSNGSSRRGTTGAGRTAHGTVAATNSGYNSYFNGNGSGAKSLKELLAEQSAMEVTAEAAQTVYNTQMGKYMQWNERRLDLLSQFTRLEGEVAPPLAALPPIPSGAMSRHGSTAAVQGRRASGRASASVAEDPSSVSLPKI